MPPASSAESGVVKVLCADDDPALLQTVSILLQSAGYDTILAHDGQEAVELFRQHQAELAAVILDLRMPRMDGITAAREIRKLSPRIPVVALSAYLSGKGSEALLRECEEAGFTGYAHKPFAAEPFLAALAEWIRSR